MNLFNFLTFPLSLQLEPSRLSFLLLTTLNFVSFWYGSLRVFKVQAQLDRQKRYWFKLLTLLTWNSSWLLILFAREMQFLMAGLGLSVISLALFWFAVRAIRQCRFGVIFDQEEPDVHVQHGPYRWIRHPFYTAYIVTYMSLALTIPFWSFRCMCLLLVISYIRAAKSEERKFLNSPLAKSYRAYVSGTGMFLPKLFR